MQPSRSLYNISINYDENGFHGNKDMFKQNFEQFTLKDKLGKKNEIFYYS